MAAAAFRGKVRLPGWGAADEHGLIGRNRIAARRSALALHGRRDAVDVLGNRFRVIVRNIDGVHSHVLTAAMNDRHDQLTLFVAQDDLRPKQIGTTLIAAAEVDAVTALAIDAVQRLAARDDRRVARRPLLRRKRRAALAATAARLRSTRSAAAAAATFALRRRLRRVATLRRCRRGALRGK